MTGWLINQIPCEDIGPDARYWPMREALRLARNGLGSTAPNPMVGAVVLRGGELVASGWHKAFGGPHAEVEAIRDAQAKGIDLSECELWVTLEPCNHTGKTPPCTRAILKAGIKSVVIGALDPNPDVAGGGAAFLRDNGVKMRTGVLRQECEDLIADFVVWKNTARPFVVLKLAATLDGKIATRSGHSQWISCEESRHLVQEMRAATHAVLVGGNTFYKDDPKLTCRLEGREPGLQPLAVVVTSRLPDPEADHYLLRQRPEHTIFFTSKAASLSKRATDLESKGCRVWGLPTASDVPTISGSRLDLGVGLERLRQEHSCLYVLCEGGGGLALNLLEGGLVDDFLLFLAPKVLGDGQASGLFHGREIARMDQALGLRLAGMSRSGADAVLTLRPLSHDAKAD